MSLIKILDVDTVNKIAAGEVIERPASALKELLENSSDSGATRIEVDFDAGGKTRLSVRDNGQGMVDADLPLALTRFATSKIKSIDDLERLNTFGFRGEALASLAAVSELRIQSSPQGALEGAEIKARGGQIEVQQPAAPISGTFIEVSNLFFNVPARLKFLKSDAGETSALKRVVKAFALSHPEIAVVLKQNGKVLEHWPSEEFLSRACGVLGAAKQDAFEINESEGDLQLQAVLLRPEKSLPTQAGIWLFVQNRPVTDRSLQFALIEGYRNLLMDHQYPQGVLKLSLNPNLVDVNVHPAKAQVKFANPAEVFRFISSRIKDSLERAVESTQLRRYGIDDLGARQESLIQDAVVKYNARNFEIAADSAFEAKASPKVAGPWSSLHLIGQFANTYLVTQSEKALVLVDQHAAHERVLFERFKNSGPLEKQLCLISETIELKEEELDVFFTDIAERALSKAGFEYDRRGPRTLSVSARPAFLTETGLAPLFTRLAEQLLEFASTAPLENVLGELWATMSCHGAIRAGRVLSHAEMKALLTQMDEFSLSSFCPHGRPVSVEISLYDFEKLFKRRV